MNIGIIVSCYENKSLVIARDVVLFSYGRYNFYFYFSLDHEPVSLIWIENVIVFSLFLR